MSMLCPCGCGEPVSFFRQSAAKAYVEALHHQEFLPPIRLMYRLLGGASSAPDNAAQWAAVLPDRLLSAVHGDSSVKLAPLFAQLRENRIVLQRLAPEVVELHGQQWAQGSLAETEPGWRFTGDRYERRYGVVTFVVRRTSDGWVAAIGDGNVRTADTAEACQELVHAYISHLEWAFHGGPAPVRT
jgi:hypothetical protein